MNPLHEFAALFSNFGNIDPRMIVMWVVGGVLVYLAIKKEMEPTPCCCPWASAPFW